MYLQKKECLKSDKTKELKFDSKAVKIAELEERKEMLVIWRRGDGWFPKDQTHHTH